jgi:hypothetical protein
MSIADAQAAAAAAASGGDGEVVGEEDDSHKRRRTEGTEGTEGDGATPMEEDASLEAAIAASMADAGGQNPFASLFTTAPPAAASPPQPAAAAAAASASHAGLSASQRGVSRAGVCINWTAGGTGGVNAAASSSSAAASSALAKRDTQQGKGKRRARPGGPFHPRVVRVVERGVH